MKWILPFLLISQAYAVDCDILSIIRENKSIYPPDKPFIELGPGQGSIPNPYFPFDRETLPDNQRRERHVRAALLKDAPSRSEQEIDQLMNEIKDLIIREIAGDGNPGPDQLLMINRIRNVKWKVDPNATAEGSLDSVTNVISLHPNVLKGPKLALVSLMSHEFSHAIDYCNAGCESYHSKPANELNTALDALPQDEKTERVRTIVTTGIQANMNEILTSGLNPDEIPRFNEFVQRANLTVSDPGVPLNRNPLRETIQCLSAKNPRFMSPPITNQNDCSYQTYGEKSAQIWAGRITGNYIQRSPVTSRAEAMGLMTNFFSPKSENNLDGKGIEMNEMFLTHPAVQTMFGCTPPAGENCMLKFNPSVTTEAPTLRNSIEGFNNLSPNPVQVNCGSNNQ